jgi:hypothetical protein
MRSSSSARATVDQRPHVFTRRLAPVPEAEHASDLAEGEAAGLGGADERQPGEDRLVRGAVAVGRRRRRREEAEGFVVADRLGRHPCAVRHPADAHRPMLCALDLPIRGKVHDGRVDITVLYVEGCPHVALACRRVADALDRLGVTATSTQRLVHTDTEAAWTGFRGSPTILVDGVDPFPTNSAAGLSCRLYRGEAGVQGAPTVDQLIEVLTR